MSHSTRATSSGATGGCAIRQRRERKKWFADSETVEREDWNLSASRYRPEIREAAEHRDPRDLLAELRDDVAAILRYVEALAAELG